MRKNLTIIDENNVYIEDGVVIGDGVKIYPNNYIASGSIIEDDVVLMPNNFIKNSHIKKGASIFFSVVEESVVGENAMVGPFARLRPQSEIGDKAKIGNFVEIKKASIGNGSKVSHLSYVGDAEVGSGVNVGCGVVFVNYNGKIKSKTIVEDGSFIGSSVNLIAPVHVGKKAFICAGTTVVKDVEEGSFVIGRSRMTVKEGVAHKYLKEEK